MAPPFRFATCNEIFKDSPFPQTCQQIRNCGYTGIEIAPFTLATHPREISGEQRRQLRSEMADAGLEFVGLHWILVSPEPLHVTTPDLELRKRSWQYLKELVDLCADLGGDTKADAQPGSNGVMVFGSPKQRSATGGMSPADAEQVFIEGLAGLAPHAFDRRVQVLVEALPMNQSDVITSLERAASVVHQINNPAIQTMFDTHNAIDETVPHTKLVRDYFDVIRHVHVNELDGKEPGQGDYPFGPLLQTLASLSYKGWVSLEAFDFSRSAETIAKGAFEHLNRQWESVHGE